LKGWVSISWLPKKGGDSKRGRKLKKGNRKRVEGIRVSSCFWYQEKNLNGLGGVTGGGLKRIRGLRKRRNGEKSDGFCIKADDLATDAEG